MKKIILILVVIFSLFMTGCKSIKKDLDIVEENVKLSISESINDDIVLMTEDLTYNATISWTSSNEEILTSSGINKNGTSEKVIVSLTYVITIEKKVREGTISVEVKPNKYLQRLDIVEEAILERIPDEVSENIKLLKEVDTYNAKIEWSCSNEKVLTLDGKNLNKSSEPQDVVLSYIITIGEYKKEGQKHVKVLTDPVFLILNKVEEKIKNIIPASTVKDIPLFSEDEETGAKISWKSSNINVISFSGIVTNYSDNLVVVTLTYKIQYDDQERVGDIKVEVPCTENFTFQVDYKEIYIGGINQTFSVYGQVLKNGEPHRAYIGQILIEGEYDPSIPGEYDLTALVNFSHYKIDEDGNEYTQITPLKDTFKLIVLTPIETTFEEINNLEFKNVDYSFGLDNYYILSTKEKLVIIDLNNPNEYITVEIIGRCNSYYYKDGYLYISSVDPYEEVYNYNFTGHIYKIDIENGTKIEEIEVNSAPGSIVVDKRNNVILSKEQNQHVSIDYLDMNTKEVSILGYCYAGDKLIYNEEDDMLLVVSNYTTVEPIIYMYNEETKAYDLIRRNYELTPLVLAPEILERYYNRFIYGSQLYDKVYAEFIDGEVITQPINIVNNYLSRFSTYEITLTEDSIVVAQCYESKKNICYITTYDIETNSITSYKSITTNSTNKLNNVFIYNNNVYVFDEVQGKLLMVK